MGFWIQDHRPQDVCQHKLGTIGNGDSLNILWVYKKTPLFFVATDVQELMYVLYVYKSIGKRSGQCVHNVPYKFNTSVETSQDVLSIIIYMYISRKEPQ